MRAFAVQNRGRSHCRGDPDQVSPLRRVEPSEAIEPPPAAARPRWKGPLVWLFIPPKDMTTFAASACVPGSADSTLGCTLQNPDIALWVMSSETVSPRPLSWRGWRTRPWLRLLYGTICDPLTAAHGAAAFISSLPVIPVSPSALQVTGAVRKTHVTSGRRLRGSSGTSRRNGASLKTSSGICPLVSTTSPETFKAWATGLQRASYQRRKLAGRTSASGCSFWPTPTFKGSGNRACIQLYVVAGVMFRNDLNQTGSQLGIWNAAKAWTLMWDLLMAAGWQPQRPVSSHPCRVILLNGEKHSDGILSANPAFSDWMMGWPPGWTDPLQPVTGWSLWLQRARGACSWPT